MEVELREASDIRKLSQLHRAMLWAYSLLACVFAFGTDSHCAIEIPKVTYAVSVQ
jgi:hypothetical protein